MHNFAETLLSRESPLPTVLTGGVCWATGLKGHTFGHTLHYFQFDSITKGWRNVVPQTASLAHFIAVLIRAFYETRLGGAHSYCNQPATMWSSTEQGPIQGLLGVCALGGLTPWHELLLLCSRPLLSSNKAMQITVAAVAPNPNQR